MSERAFPSSSSAGQPSQPKRPCFASIDRALNGFETNPVVSRCLTKEDVRSVVREELEHAKSDLVERFESCLRNALKDIVPHTPSENGFQILKERVESAKSHSPHLRRSDAKSMANNGARNLRLQLPTKLLLPVYTGKEIEGEEGARIEVALIDANTGEIVTSGPISSIKLDVVVLEGDFNKDNEDNWAPEEFLNYVVKERKGKRPLLTGELIVKLKEGVGEVGQMIFTDNSSWNRSKTFRIGLKVASGFCGDTRIREAITDPFPVKEHRGEAYKKHHPPASDDEVWRLENIAKEGIFHQKLSEAGIYKVEDFLLQLFTDPKKLKEILGKSISKKKWESLVCHAKTCKTKWGLYLDYTDGVTKHGAVFNIDGQLIGLIQDREYFATHQLFAEQKEHAETIVKKAFANWNNVREFSSETFSDSVQKGNSSSFSSQVFDGQIGNVNPVQHSLALSFSAAPAGLRTHLANVNSTAEGLVGATALALLAQSQNISRGNSMHSQIAGYDNIQPSEPAYHSVSSFHSSGAPAPPEGSHTMEDDYVDEILADIPPCYATNTGNFYPVFFIFIGPDTRHGFIDYLYHGLVNAGIQTFRDDDKLCEGESIKPMLTAAIPNSKILNLIPSVTYGTRKWCLDELVQMMELKNNNRRMVLPISDKVKPAEGMEDLQFVSSDNADADSPPYNDTFDREPRLPEVYYKMEDPQSSNSDNYLDKLFADTPPRCGGTFQNGAVRGANKGVLGWLKIKAVLQWGFFIKKRGVRLVELDSPPIQVQACS